MNNQKKIFGLIGKNIAYSFSRNYFNEKFKKLGLKDYSYVNFDIPEIENFSNIFMENNTTLGGMNVTIPYKEAVIPYLDELDTDAKKIGAVNTIKILPNGRTKGYNTDVYGFENALKPLLKGNETHALILGTGGASKAIAFVLKKLNISYLYVSRTPKNSKTISYSALSESIIKKHTLIVNSTPLGTHPNIKDCPQIPYQFLSEGHVLFDLIYNPAITAFLDKGRQKGAAIKNGEQMLELQAEKAWEIWNN